MTLKKMEEAYIECRMLRHAWEQFGVPKRQRSWGTTVTFRCWRCGMERDDTYDLQGELSMRAYVQPKGYHLTKDETPRIQELRREYLRRQGGGKSNANPDNVSSMQKARRRKRTG